MEHYLVIDDDGSIYKVKPGSNSLEDLQALVIGRIELVPQPMSEFEADRVVLRLKAHAKAIREIKTKHIDFIEAVAISTLLDNLQIPLSDLLNIIKSLQRRSLIEKQENNFTLSPLLKQYVFSNEVGASCHLSLHSRGY